jgi:hypothetical protein
MPMHWIVQTNVFKEDRYAQVIETLERGGIPHTIVTVVPFSHEIIPCPRASNPIAVIGSYLLVKRAHELGWGPGVFSTDITFPAYAEAFGRDLLNHGARVCSLGEVALEEASFLRPIADGKDFPGTVVAPDELASWREGLCDVNGHRRVSAETRVVVAALREIHAEYRFFVVDGQIVAASRYKLGGRMSPAAEIAPEAATAAEGFVARWQPDRAFVIDVALTPDGPKVIEINNINAAGWYHADVSRVIQAIDALE